MTTRQRIFDTASGSRTVSTAATMYFAGDGHSHWHIRDLERFRLYRRSDGARVGVGAKHGFCFWDNTQYNLSLPGAPESKKYLGCGTSGLLQVRMGLSVGWGDRYPASLRDQYIDITGLPAGDYRLTVWADNQNWFAESNNDNNKAITYLRISDGATRVWDLRPRSGA